VQALINKIEGFIDWTGRAVSWLTLLMVIVTFIVVVLRYMFDIGWIALQESVTYLHALVFLAGASWAMQQEAHVRVDIFYSRYSDRTRAWVDLLGSLLLLLPVMVFIVLISWRYVADSWSVLEGSREAGGLPAVFLLKSLIIVMAVMLSLQAVVQIARSVQRIRKTD
jgi:TRAP-type mannitol/chloroaromatic compound transport system permease small subunit